MSDANDLVELGRAIARAQDARVPSAVPPFASTQRQPRAVPTLFGGMLIGALVATVGALAVWEWSRTLPACTVVVTVAGASEALVRLDDRPPVNAIPSVTLEHVGVGAHTIVVEQPGYLAYSAPFYAVAGTPLVQIKATLVHMPGTLVVMSTPPDAAIFVDGKDTGFRTPHPLELEGDIEHEVKVVAGNVTSRKFVRVRANDRAMLDFDL